LTLTEKWILTQKFEILKIQFIEHMKPKKEEGHSGDASVLLRKWNKTLTGGNMETKCGAETEGKASSPWSPSHIQSPNLDSILDPGKGLLTGLDMTLS
jgi:hypothetical protein